MIKNFSKKIYFTTSWDDGSLDDIKIAELLKKEGIKGTFYIPQKFPYSGGKFSKYKMMDENSLRYLSEIQEIGAHTLNHQRLDSLNFSEIEKEVSESKKFLEDLIGKEVLMFAYPQGKYNEEAIVAVKRARYRGARITRKMIYKLPSDLYLIGVSIRVAPFPFRKIDEKNYYWRKLLDPLREYFPNILKLIPNLYSWQAFTRAFLKLSIKQGNYFHLYGHSWEIEKYGMWDELKKFIDYVKNFKKNIIFVNNSEIANIISKKL